MKKRNLWWAIISNVSVCICLSVRRRPCTRKRIIKTSKKRELNLYSNHDYFLVFYCYYFREVNTIIYINVRFGFSGLILYLILSLILGLQAQEQSYCIKCRSFWRLFSLDPILNRPYVVFTLHPPPWSNK